MSAVISVRIPRELREKLKRCGINIAEVVRRSLLKGVDQEDVGKQLDFLRDKLRGRLDPYELARIVDEDRERRQCRSDSPLPCSHQERLNYGRAAH